MTINCPVVPLAPATLPNGTIGLTYDQTLTASGSTSPYTFATTTGTLPDGLTLGSDGVLSGFPTTGGTSNFTVTATATNGCPGSLAYSVFINTPPTISASAPLSRSRGNEATPSQIATVTDPDQALNTLIVSATPLTGTGVTISSIVVDVSGNVTASVAAGCCATDSTFTLTVTDSQGDTATAVLTVNATPDSQPPTISCPANIIQATDPNHCSAVVTFLTPAATDNCSAPVVCSPATGTAFAKGLTTVTCTATDAGNNTASCTFTVTINDTQPPAVTCPANITSPAAPNQCSAVVIFSVSVMDNCPGVTVQAVPPSGSTFPKGTTTVTTTATDATGTSSTCSFTVTVADTQPPTIACPANVTVVVPTSGATCVTATYPAPVVSDNCPGVTFTCSPASGSCFPIGATTVTCTATDASGNTATCSFGVSTFSLCLQDDSNPSVVVLVNTLTGDYRFCCGGTVYMGRGTLSVKGNLVTVEHSLTTRRVSIKVDRGTRQGTASYASPPGAILCQIRDTNITNNGCACQ